MDVEHRRREAAQVEWIEKGLMSCLNAYMFVCFSDISRDWEHLKNRKWYSVVGSWIIHCLDMFLAHLLFSARAWRESVDTIGFSIMVRAIAATVARDLGSDSLLPKLRNYGESEMRVQWIASPQKEMQYLTHMVTAPKVQNVKWCWSECRLEILSIICA